MDFFSLAFGFIFNIDKYLALVLNYFGFWTYPIFFLVVFSETGLVVAPFLPGDSLLFASGAFAALGLLDVRALFLVFALAAIAGDSVNYWIGSIAGPKIFMEKSRFLKKDYLDKSREFYERHGGKTIFMARFIPIIRTFAPFVAGMGKMDYRKFMLYNVSGAISWVALFLFAGYFFGNLPVVKENLSILLIAIIVLSLLPAFAGFALHKMKGKKN
ncbi:MAG: DedA family protein [archaeon]